MIYFLDSLNLGKAGKYSKLMEIIIYSLSIFFCIFCIILSQNLSKWLRNARKDIMDRASLALLWSLDLAQASKQTEIL